MTDGRTGHGNSRFFLGMGIYALVFLGLLTAGLIYFWNYLDAYEKTRVEYTLEAYMEELSPEHIANRCTELIERRDSRIQSEGEALGAICQALTGDIQYAKNIKNSTEEKLVYFLRLGSRNIGSVTLRQTGESLYGFNKWRVESESFDLFYLLSEPLSATVPEPFQVSVNGKVLSADMIAEDGIRYEQLSALPEYEDFPTKVRYEAGPVIGSCVLTVLDELGEPVDGREADAVFLENCTDEEKADLDKFIDRYIGAYVAFASRAGDNTDANLGRLAQYVVSGSALYNRLWGSVDSLTWVSDRYAYVKSIETDFYTCVSEGRYVCDITYTVSSNTINGRVDSTDTTKILIVRTAYGLRAEAMV